MAETGSASPQLSTEKPVSIAILAMGGQGGGVLADWIVEVAESEGWAAQSTSVPGVAQRTGATIYYIEMLPPKDGVPPVLSLMPTPGDVDVVMAAELMEAGRSVLRGLVTPDRTTLIASTHRAFAVAEKEKPGNGIGDGSVVVEGTDFAARRVIAFDMEKLAAASGSMISATMLGALAASGALPFQRSAFETVVREGARGANASLTAFGAAYDKTKASPREPVAAAMTKRFGDLPIDAGHPELNRLVTRIHDEFPNSAHPMLFAGLKRAVDFQDVAYGDEYLDLVGALAALDRANGGAYRGFAFTQDAAKYVAVAMSYDDVVRVADLKTRPSRFARMRAEVGVSNDQIVYPTDYMHPRMEEVCGALPVRVGAWIESKPWLFRALDKLVNRGRRIGSGRIGGFMALTLVSSMRSWRRATLRHHREIVHREAWLALSRAALPHNYDLAVEILRCRRLVKGYSDTHSRGQSKFDRVLAAMPKLLDRSDGADWLRRLRQAALLDEAGAALDGVMKTVDTL